jgi:hypothetical protein
LAITLPGAIRARRGSITNPPRSTPYGEAEKTFKLSVPRTSTTLHQGETKEVAIGIERGKNFEGDVTLKFAGGPEGVTIESASPTIKHGDTEAKATLKATADASLGDFTVKVRHPIKGPDATSEQDTVARRPERNGEPGSPITTVILNPTSSMRMSVPGGWRQDATFMGAK